MDVYPFTWKNVQKNTVNYNATRQRDLMKVHNNAKTKNITPVTDNCNRGVSSKREFCLSHYSYQLFTPFHV